ncbi:Gfo/Idh/MocA family protein [Rhodococcus wratislaviensis]|uniref:Oxidoreductase n=1 Tax=Rhodococcus wratislaviensis NBRC 100605 TaxID=1219028 RepID=X0Q1N3_RHOWR|nr:Gfo/Idh/MocA family oxidoreductase [Rhodococcus wratislaviensis]GAF50024.1 hypothetical protein RW1_094_00640 [Rhodococcus wratislaviensis NBRC 100605]
MHSELAVVDAAIIGLGRWGQRLVNSVQADGVSNGSGIRITSGYSRTRRNAEGFANQQGIQLFDDVESLLREADVSAVLIASPHSKHVEQIIAAAEAGLHVYVEKPLALDVAGALRAVDACSRTSRVLAVGFNRRYLPAYQRMQDLSANGELGQLTHVEGNFSGPFGYDYRSDNWHSSGSETPSGGMTLMGVHILDAMIGIAGHVHRVHARSRRLVLQIPLDDTTDVALEFNSGATGYLSTSTATASSWRLQVFGSAGWAHLIDEQTLIVRLIGEEPRIERFDHIDLERSELRAFARSITSGAPSLVPVLDAVNGVIALNCVHDSVHSGQPALLEHA